jgi:hypothetical protein
VRVIKDDNNTLTPIGPDIDTYGLPGGGRYVEYLTGEARSSVPAWHLRLRLIGTHTLYSAS